MSGNKTTSEEEIGALLQQQLTHAGRIVAELRSQPPGQDVFEDAKIEAAKQCLGVARDFSAGMGFAPPFVFIPAGEENERGREAHSSPTEQGVPGENDFSPPTLRLPMAAREKPAEPQNTIVSGGSISGGNKPISKDTDRSALDEMRDIQERLLREKAELERLNSEV